MEQHNCLQEMKKFNEIGPKLSNFSWHCIKCKSDLEIEEIPLDMGGKKKVKWRFIF